MIPFLEHDDANRALMGSNMQRQAVPLLKTDAPLVGTGMERRAAFDSGDVLLARNAGVVDFVDATRIVVATEDGGRDEYELQKFMRSNQGTLIHHKPVIKAGQQVGGRPAAGRRLVVGQGRDGAGQEPDASRSCPGRATTSRTRSSCRAAWSRTTS